MSDVLARLVVRQGPRPNEEYILSEPRTIIGRAQTNDIGITDPEISRQHAQIIRHENNFAIEDLGSTNGTFVNSRRITGLTPLNDGDLIDLGEAVRLIFLRGAPQPAAGSGGPTEAAGMQAGSPMAMGAVPPPTASGAPVPEPRSNRRRQVIGCGCGFLLLIFLCAAAFYFLDAYEGGRLLYCGSLQSFFETTLEPFGFSPACALDSAFHWGPFFGAG